MALRADVRRGADGFVPSLLRRSPMAQPSSSGRPGALPAAFRETSLRQEASVPR